MDGDGRLPEAGVRIRDPGRRFPPWAAILVLGLILAISGVAVYVYTRSPPLDFTGFRILAPPNGCWAGTVGVAGSVQNVSGCGSRDIRMTCVGFIALYVTQEGTDVWTITAIVYVNGGETQRTSQTGAGGTLTVSQQC